MRLGPCLSSKDLRLWELTLSQVAWCYSLTLNLVVFKCIQFHLISIARFECYLMKGIFGSIIICAHFHAAHIHGIKLPNCLTCDTGSGWREHADNLENILIPYILPRVRWEDWYQRRVSLAFDQKWANKPNNQLYTGWYHQKAYKSHASFLV